MGATLLYDSIPEMEERETRLKATGFFRALAARAASRDAAIAPRAAGGGVRRCCWWITTTASSTRWRTMRGRPARRWSPIARAFRSELIDADSART